MSKHAATTTDGVVSDPAVSAIVDADRLQVALGAVGAVVDECVLRVDEKGVVVDAQDPATVALVSMTLPADRFEAYNVTETRFGVDLGRLQDVVGMADGDERVRLAVDQETRTLHIRVGELAYTLGLIDPDSVRSPPENADFSDAFTATVTLSGESISDAVEAADMVADHLELGVDADDELLYASAEGDTDTVRLEFPAEECGGFEGGGARSLYSVSYLDSVAGVLPDDADVTLRTGQEAPIELTFSLDGAAVEYVVAPRISRS